MSEPPFSITPDPRYLYMSERHRESLAHLLYGVGEGGGFVLLTGEVGTGKTTVCRCFLEQLPPAVDVALILNPRLNGPELLATICDELGVGYPAGTTSLKVLVDALDRHLLDAHARGRRTVLILDEAQDLPTEVLEQIRLLTNLETTTEKLLQVVLIGQPELLRLLEGPTLRQLAQRVTARYHLTPLSREETGAYVRHRLEVAGRGDPIFSEAALGQVHRLSGGVPRLINLICDRALLGAYTQEKKQVDPATVRRATAEVVGPRPRARATRRLRPLATVGAVAVACAGALILLMPTGLSQLAGSLKGPPGGPSTRDGPSSLSEPSGLPPRRSVVGARDATEGATAALADLLRDPALVSDKRSAFASLYARWGVDYRDTGGDLACERGRPGPLECLVRTGTWKKLRRSNVAAILELVTPIGQPRYATMTRLGADKATLEFGGRAFTVPLAEIDAFWEGTFILLWRMPAPGPITIAPGARGQHVAWLRQRLDEVDGRRTARAVRDAYDDELKERVMAFQISRSLPPDGIVGIETLAQLSAAVREPGIPWLSPAPR